MHVEREEYENTALTISEGGSEEKVRRRERQMRESIEAAYEVAC